VGILNHVTKEESGLPEKDRTLLADAGWQDIPRIAPLPFDRVNGYCALIVSIDS